MSELIKLVLVDLDGVLWDGVLLEDGLAELRLNQPLAERLRRLDGMGVLLAVISKNHPDDVEEALLHFGVSDLFVTREVSFEPKSEGVTKALRLFRFAPEACLFIDDTAFEREEVSHAFPGMRTVTPEDFIKRYSGDEAWAVASAPEAGRLRKQSYIEEKARRAAEMSHTGAFRQFLRQSGLTLKVGPAAESSAERISELTQRTNQINFSSNRYDPEAVRQLLASPRHQGFIATAADRYGDYGMIGFACLRHEGGQAVIQDLMLSCRIQGKGVESAFIAVLAEKAKAGGVERFIGLYRPTRRNGRISGAFQALGFTPAGEEGGYQRFVINPRETLPARPSHIRVVVSNTAVMDEDVGIPFIRAIVRTCVADKLVRGTILDVGAGWDGVLGENCDQFLEQDSAKHIRLDVERYPRTDIVADAQDMAQIDDESFDSALCLEVLEHCENPFALSKELIRVLRSGGVAVVSAPMNFPIHDTPGDYWRFTPDGLKHLFDGKAAVVSEHIEGKNDHPVRTVLVLRK